MKKVIANAFVCGIMSFTFSCQKGSNDVLPPANTKVKTYTEDITSPSFGHVVTTYNLNYDASDRITSVVSSTNPGDKFVYSYPSDNAIWSDLYVGGALSIHYEGYYKNNSIDSVFQYNDSGHSTTEKYIYNSSGYFIKSYEYEYSKVAGSVLSNTITYTYDAGGNQLKAEDTDTNVETFEYYTDKVYFYPLIGPALIPSVKRNLLKSHTITSNGSHVGSGSYTYTFDSSDRISTWTETVDDGTVVIKTFTYF